MSRKQRKKDSVPSAKTNLKKHMKPFLAVMAVFTISRVAFYAAGVRFDAYIGEHLMHYISPELLKTDLTESLFYLHNQPPAFNAFLGVVFKLFPEGYVTVFGILYVLMGISLAAGMYVLMTGLGVSAVTAAVLTSVFVASPACILFENLLLYTYPVIVLLSLSAVSLTGYVKKNSAVYCVLFFIAVTLVVLTRSLFHLMWLAAILALLIIRGRSRKRIVLACASPCLLVFLLYAKNMYLLGSFSGSTWLGMSLSKLTTQKMPEEERIDLVRKGKLTGLALLPPFKPVWYYRQHVRIPKFRETGVPILDLEYYPDVGHNWNNVALYSISKQYGRDAHYVLRHRPGVYFGSVMDSFRIYLFPATDWFHFYASVDNIASIGSCERFYNAVFCGQLLSFPDREEKRGDQEGYFENAYHIGLFITLVYCAALWHGITQSVKIFRRDSHDDVRLTVIAYITLTIVYVMLAGNLLETGENERFRFNTDPFALTLFGLFIHDIRTRFGTRKQRP